jgi:hypothetical protein
MNSCERPQTVTNTYERQRTHTMFYWRVCTQYTRIVGYHFVGYPKNAVNLIFRPSQSRATAVMFWHAIQKTVVDLLHDDSLESNGQVGGPRRDGDVMLEPTGSHGLQFRHCWKRAEVILFHGLGNFVRRHACRQESVQIPSQGLIVVCDCRQVDTLTIGARHNEMRSTTHHLSVASQ